LKTSFTNNYWKNLFNKNAELFKNNLSNLNNLFVAFNANIDYIKKITPDFFLKFEDINENCSLPNLIESIDDFKKAIIFSSKRGKAVELKINNHELYEYLLKKIKYDNKRIGGQMGIVANNLSTLGVKKTIIFTNVLSKIQAKFFKKNIYFPTLLNNKLTLKPAKDCGSERDKTRINLIFEFNEGLKIKVKNGTIIIPRNNRFIVSSPYVNNPPLIPKSLMKAELFSKVDRIFLSGYHHITKKQKHLFVQWKNQIETIKQFNPKMMIHLEYVDLHQEWLSKELFKILKMVDSFGINEVELMNLVKSLGEESLSKKIVKSNYSSKYLIDAGLFVMKEFKLKRVNIHTLECLINLTTKDYPVNFEKLIHSNIFAIRVTNARAISGESFAQSLKGININSLNKKGIEESKIVQEKDYNLIIVPNFNKNIKIKYTVGLGDTISSTSFYSEII